MPPANLMALASPRLLSCGPNLLALQFSNMKIGAAVRMIDAAPDKQPLIETSSGTMGLALAMVASHEGRALTLVTPPLETSVMAHLKVLGAHVIEVCGDQNARLRRLHDELSRNPALYWTRQYDSPLVPDSYAPFGDMLAAAGVDVVVAAVGSGGSACGLIKPVRAQRPGAWLVAVDAMNSTLFGRADGRRDTSGIGNSLMPGHLDHRAVDQVHWLSDRLMASAAWRVSRHLGLLVGPTGAAAFEVAQWHARRCPDLKHVAILPDEGHRYLSTVFAKTVDDLQNISPLELSVADAQRHEALGPGGPDWLMAEWNRRPLSHGLGQAD